MDLHGALCASTELAWSSASPSGCRFCTLPEMAPPYISGRLTGRDIVWPCPGTSVTMSRIELAGQTKFQEFSVEKQWDSRLLRFETWCTPGGAGSSSGYEDIRGGGVMVGLRYPSLSRAPPLPTPGETAVERSSANSKKMEGLAVQLS